MGIAKMDSDPLEQGHLPKAYCCLSLEPKAGFSWERMEGCRGWATGDTLHRSFLRLRSLYHLEPRVTRGLMWTRHPETLPWSWALFIPPIPSSKHTHGSETPEMCLFGRFLLLCVPLPHPRKAEGSQVQSTTKIKWELEGLENWPNEWTILQRDLSGSGCQVVEQPNFPWCKILQKARKRSVIYGSKEGCECVSMEEGDKKEKMHVYDSLVGYF